MARERGGLRGHAFHETAVARKDVGPVVDDLPRGRVEARCEHGLRYRHAHSVGEALAKGPGRGLDARDHAVFGMARAPRAELAEALDLVKGDAIAGEVEKGVEEHRAMAGG